jgi:hypothetical protein
MVAAKEGSEGQRNTIKRRGREPAEKGSGSQDGLAEEDELEDVSELVLEASAEEDDDDEDDEEVGAEVARGSVVVLEAAGSVVEVGASVVVEPGSVVEVGAAVVV